MKRYYVGKEALDLVDSEGFELNYYILEDEVDEEDMRFSKYGIEIENNQVGVRSRKDGDIGAMSLSDFEEKLDREVKNFER